MYSVPPKGTKMTVTGFIRNTQSSSNEHSAELRIMSLAGSADDDSVAEALDYLLQPMA